MGLDDAGLQGVSSSSPVLAEKTPETRDLRRFGLNGNAAAAAAAAVAFQMKHESKLWKMIIVLYCEFK